MKQNNYPREFWVDRDVFFSGGICSHVSNKNEIEGGIKCYPAHKVDEDLFLGKFYMWIVTIYTILSLLLELLRW